MGRVDAPQARGVEVTGWRSRPGRGRPAL